MPSPPAHASSSQLSIMMDDDLLLYSGDDTRDKALQQMQTLGADAVRVTVLWTVVANGTDPKVKPKNKKEKAALTANLKRFKKYGAADPRAYPPHNWDRFDRLARACVTTGLICYFDVTGPGPSYAMTKPPAQYKKDAAWWEPKARQFKLFVEAVGKRFDGHHLSTDRKGIPKVSMWSLWNEPNQGGWLRPQWLDGKPVSPRLYRELYIAGHQGLVATGHNNDAIFVGETAPISVARQTTTSGMGPRTFINEMLCGPGSTGDGCATDFKTPILATAWAHHPYTKQNAPNVPSGNPDEFTLANINDLGAELDAEAAATGHIESGMPIVSSEFGYETNPPDPYAKSNLQQQAYYDELGELLTYVNPRIVGQTQFLLRDVKPNKRYRKDTRNYWATYQSGLLGSTGIPKPAFSAYELPFLQIGSGVDATNGLATVSVFGMLRFRANVLSAQAPDSVQLQFLPDDGSYGWTDLGTPIPVTDPLGYFTATADIPAPGKVRAQWVGPQYPFDVTSLPGTFNLQR